MCWQSGARGGPVVVVDGTGAAACPPGRRQGLAGRSRCAPGSPVSAALVLDPFDWRLGLSTSKDPSLIQYSIRLSAAI
ncbi:hypothetical protein NDU88_000984 [Pleurodeles waltl]|uniref:Uncharacterized protein n=1 Tax=Pleurodeles waltl TaxID=8319 RepID=A0AAV7VYT3_PLEWA|nr:hypothetical protein NDU88_000984 [Pleurodeles waltl]